MEDTAITLQEAIVQVDAWLAIADHGCRVWGGHTPMTKPEQRFYDMYIAKWAAYKDVALLLARVVEEVSEYEKHDTE